MRPKGRLIKVPGFQAFDASHVSGGKTDRLVAVTNAWPGAIMGRRVRPGTCLRWPRPNLQGD